MIDRKPPQATDLEAIVLGSVLLDREAFDTVAPIINDKCFYEPKNGLIWQTIERVHKDKSPIDIVTVSQRLKKDGYIDQVGGLMYVSQLTDRVGSTANIEFHARIILQKYIQREIASATMAISARCYEDTADVIDLQTAIRNLYDFTLNHTISGREATHIVEAIKRDIDSYDRRAEARKKGLPTGVKTGLSELNRMTLGLQKSTLNILAARPAMGKTSLAMHIARYCDVPVLIFSIEMSEAQLTQRLVITESCIDAHAYKSGWLNDSEMIEVSNARASLADLPMFIDDTTPITISDMRAKALKFKRKHEGKDILIIVDYLQLIKNSERKGNREQEVADVSKGLKEISKVCDCPVLALAQLSRAVEQRGGDKRPQLSDLRESGQIEQDADMVIFLHRPEYYGITTDENGNSTQGKCEIIIAKHRDGSTGSVIVDFISGQTKFIDPAQAKQMQPNADFLSKNDLPY